MVVVCISQECHESHYFDRKNRIRHLLDFILICMVIHEYACVSVYFFFVVTELKRIDINPTVSSAGATA